LNGFSRRDNKTKEALTKRFKNPQHSNHERFSPFREDIVKFYLIFVDMFIGLVFGLVLLLFLLFMSLMSYWLWFFPFFEPSLYPVSFSERLMEVFYS